MLETIATVESNQILSPVYGRLVLRIPSRVEFKAGQFVMVRPVGVLEPILRRALAVYKSVTSESSTSIELLYQVFGRGLDQLMRVRANDAVDCLGPLGNSFPIPDQPREECILVAGGIGSAALYMIAEQFKDAGRPVRLFFGAGTKSALIGIEDFQRLGIEVTTSTDDGSAGFHGLITDALESYLVQNPRQSPTLFTCGPYPMMRRVAEIATKNGLTAFVSIETRMACGFGVCVGCVHPIRSETGGGFTYKRVCIDGPIFNSQAVVW